ncbi:MAG: 16S rRNA (guanine(966)-N(2))-methyltransferase RsmD, partial [Deltaproteobacteria bacterium]
AGTGNLGIEALSRGARKVVFVEKNREALNLIEKNLSVCGLKDRSEVLFKDVTQAIGRLKGRGERFDLIFMDPPYEKGLIDKTIGKIFTEKIYSDDSLVVIEHNRREPLPDITRSWNLIRQRRIGDTVVSFLTPLKKEENS